MSEKKIVLVPDKQWRITIPKKIRKQISAEAFVLELVDGAIVLKPVELKEIKHA